MARYYPGASPGARFSQSRRLGEGKGRRREAGPEGISIGMTIDELPDDL